MKPSFYNIYIPTEDKRCIVFNGLTKKFFVIGKHNEQGFKHIINFPDEYSKNEAYADLLQLLQSNGFIIENERNELNDIKQAFEKYKTSKFYTLMIMTTYACNFSCWYCVQKHQNLYISDEIEEKIKKHIQSYLIDNDIKNFNISWFGGEPLLNFNKIKSISVFAKEFCEKHNIGFNCGITTNGSLITPEMVKEMKELCFNNFQITIDGSKNNHNKTRFNEKIKNSFDLILSNIKLIVENIPNVVLTLRINYTHENLSQTMVKDIDEILSPVKDRIDILFRKVWQEADDDKMYDTANTLMRDFKCRGYRVSHDYDDIKYISCYVERSHYNSIFPNGLVDKCSNKDISEARGYLSYNGEIIWKISPVECQKNIFTTKNECIECKYLPLCMGPCPARRENGKNIQCIYLNKEQAFLHDIKSYCQIRTCFKI